MNNPISIGTPVACVASTIGSMSSMTVRAAHVAANGSRAAAISCANARTSLAALAPAAGNPKFTDWTPSAAVRWSRVRLSATGGSMTEAPWPPSRSVSSCTVTPRTGRANGAVPPAVFQSYSNVKRSIPRILLFS